MWGPWWGGPGWIAGLIGGVFWLLIIVLAIVFLRRELPHLQLHHHHASPALRLIEERYAKGEITREEFLYRRHVLLGASREPTGPVPPSTGGPPGGSPTYTPGAAHVRVTAAPPPVQPRPAPSSHEEKETPRPPSAARPSAEPVPDPGAAEKPPGGRGRRRKPTDPTEPLPPVPPPEP